MTELYEMGWNDVLGNLRRAFEATAEEKAAWCESVKKGEIGLPRWEADFIEGAKAAAEAFLTSDNPDSLEFKGLEYVVKAMKQLVDDERLYHSPEEGCSD